MKAIGYAQRGAVSSAESVVEFETDKPEPAQRDLIVEVKGISVNPVDVKVRMNRQPPEGSPRILGFDAAGIVTKVGASVSGFKPGDEVFYAGDFTRSGSNAEYQAVDERLVGFKPANLSFADSAAMPLTGITAWEILFDSFKLQEGDGNGDALLIIGAAGGVGSMLIQLAKKLTCLTVIATASRQETQDWVNKMGADYVIDHHKPLEDEIKGIGVTPRYVASLNNTDKHFASIIELIEPRGHITIIDDPNEIDIAALKLKALTFSWEFMFSRSMFHTKDMDSQHKLLNRISELVENGELISTVNEHFGELNEANLRRALEFQMSGKAVGKSILGGINTDD